MANLAIVLNLYLLFAAIYFMADVTLNLLRFGIEDWNNTKGKDYYQLGLVRGVPEFFMDSLIEFSGLLFPSFLRCLVWWYYIKNLNRLFNGLQSRE